MLFRSKEAEDFQMVARPWPTEERTLQLEKFIKIMSKRPQDRTIIKPDVRTVAMTLYIPMLAVSVIGIILAIILIFVNKYDRPEAMDVTEIVDKLGLHSLPRCRSPRAQVSSPGRGPRPQGMEQLEMIIGKSADPGSPARFETAPFAGALVHHRGRARASL